MVNAELAVPTKEPSKRRDAFPFIGPIRQGDTIPLFPVVEPAFGPPDGSMDHWYLASTKEDRVNIKAWMKVFKDIIGVPSIRQTRNLFDNFDQLTLYKQQEIIEGINTRFRHAFAARHRITITDDTVPSGLEHSLGFNDFVLKNTRNGENLSMKKQDVDGLIRNSFLAGYSVYPYLENSQTGILKNTLSEFRGRINEISQAKSPFELFRYMFSSGWPAQMHFESRKILLFTDLAAEILLYRPKLEQLKRDVTEVFDKELFTHLGPKKKMDFITLHEPKYYSVVGIQQLHQGDKYIPNPLIFHQKLEVRGWYDSEGKENFGEITDDIKGIESYILKMIRNNTYDPAAIHDKYRMMAIVPNRSDVEKFIDAVKSASLRFRKPIEIIQEEGALDGKPYEAMTDGRPSLHAGSSRRYQVDRQIAYFHDNPDLTFEISLYTPEAYVNWITRFQVNVGEYLFARQVNFDEEKVDASVLEYLYPRHIYGIDFSSFSDSTIESIRAGITLRPFIPNEFQSVTPVYLTESRINSAANSIADQIQPPPITHNPEYSNWPEIIIAIGPNCHTAADVIKNRFNSPEKPVITLNFDGGIEDVQVFLKRFQAVLSEKRVLVLDDVGTTSRTSDYFVRSIDNAQAAFLVVRSGSEISDRINQGERILYGETILNTDYAFFPAQLHEFREQSQSVFGLVYRDKNGQLEVLVQDETKIDNTKRKLPGGRFDPEDRGDQNTLETLRWEISEELGPDMNKQLMQGMLNVFPLDMQVLTDPDGPHAEANTLHLLAYLINGNHLEDNFTAITAEIQAGEILQTQPLWLPINEAINTMHKPGYQLLLEKFKQLYESQNGQILSTLKL